MVFPIQIFWTVVVFPNQTFLTIVFCLFYNTNFEFLSGMLLPQNLNWMSPLFPFLTIVDSSRLKELLSESRGQQQPDMQDALSCHAL